jgi:hypoxanthine phosphoribosyltransferase
VISLPYEKSGIDDDNQPSKNKPKVQLKPHDIFKNIMDSVYTKILAIGGFIYLIIKLYEIYNIYIPQEFKTPTILAIFLLVSFYSFYKIYKWIVLLNYQNIMLINQNENLINNPKDPAITVKTNIEYRDVEFATYCLVKRLIDLPFLVYTDNSKKKIDTEKNIIIGIDRGGAIIGGLIGKSLRIATKTLAIMYANPPLRNPGGIPSPIKSGECLDNLDFPHIERVILVGDAIREGKSMEAAIKLLDYKKKSHKFEYMIVCVLHVIPYEGHIRPFIPLYVYHTTDGTLKMPWDEMHWDEIQNSKFDELCYKKNDKQIKSS